VTSDRPPSEGAASKPDGRDALTCLGLSVLWWAPLLVIGIHGDFPLNDDFAYARTTQTLLETGRFERSPWTWAPIYTHVALGVAFSWPFGFSFEALRLSSLCMGWLGVLGAYLLCRQAGAGRGPSRLGALALGLNPLYLNLSYTFMTDVPFTALCVWSLLLLGRGLRLRSGPALLAGLGFALLAALSRQSGAALPAALLLALGVSRRETWRRRRIPIGSAAGAGLLLGAWLLFGGAGSRIFAALEYPLDALLHGDALRALGANALTSVSYLGLFAAPVVGLVATGAGRAGPLAVGSALCGGLGVLAAALAGRRMPFGINVLYDLGVGPPTLHGARALAGGPAWLWWLATFAALASAAFCAALLGRGAVTRSRGQRRRAEALLLPIFPLVYLAPFLVVGNFFDRYLLPVLPCLVALLLSLPARPGRATRPGWAAALLLLAPLATLAVLGTRDYLEHHRARWALIGTLVDRGVPLERIEGGFELDGWSTRDPGPRQLARWAARRWVGFEESDFVLSHLALGARSGLRAIDARAYRRLLPPRIEVLTLFEKTGGARGDPRRVDAE
jgi:4-amino-4-deoxy-L-arabinose transferase-like glycosyltransferase